MRKKQHKNLLRKILIFPLSLLLALQFSLPMSTLAGDDVQSAMQGVNTPGAYGQSYSNQLAVNRSGNNQRDNQRDSQGNNNDGGGAASSLASKLMSIAMMLFATGAALNAIPPCHCKGMPLIAAGMIFSAGSGGAKNAANKMFDRAAVSGNFKADLNPIGTFDQGIKTNAISAKEKSTKFKADGEVNKEALYSGKIGEAFDDLEKKFGIDREDFAKSISGGEGIGEYLQKHGALGGKSLDAFNEELAAEKVDEDELMEKYKNGEYDEYANAILPKNGPVAGASLAGLAPNGAANAPAKTFDQMMSDLFNKKAGDQEVNKENKTEPEQTITGLTNLSDAAIRELASNKNYHVSADLVPTSSSIYQEPTVFDRIRYRYKVEMQGLLPTDYFIRLQSEKKERQ